MEQFCGLCSLTKGAYFIGAIDITWKVGVQITLLFGLTRFANIDSTATSEEAKAKTQELFKFSIIFMFVALIPPILLIIGAWKRISCLILVWIVFTIFDMLLYFFGLITMIGTILWMAFYIYLIISMWYLYKQIKLEQRSTT